MHFFFVNFILNTLPYHKTKDEEALCTDVYYETKLLSGVIIQNKYRRPYQNTRDFRNNKRLTRVEELILKTNIILRGDRMNKKNVFPMNLSHVKSSLFLWWLGKMGRNVCRWNRYKLDWLYSKYVWVN